MTFTYTDMYMYSLRTYDQAVQYTAFTPVSYICIKGEIPAPAASAKRTWHLPPLFSQGLFPDMWNSPLMWNYKTKRHI